MPQFRLPDVGEGLTEAEIVTWRVAVGDVVAVNDVLVDIETAKSIVELPSPFAGTVTAVLVSEGSTVAVGTPIIEIVPAAVVAEQQAESPSAQPAMLVGYGPREETGQRRRRRSVTSDGAPKDPAAVRSGSAVRVLAKPPVRKLAKDLGVDLRQVPSDGPVVTRAEVEAFASAATDPAAGSRRVPLSGVRRATATAMVASAFTAPQVTEWVTVDVSRTVELVERLKADRAFAHVHVTPTLLVAKAVCLALRRTPELHARWDETHLEFPEHVGLGIAAATERGLVVPVVRRADTLGLAELGAAIDDLVAVARSGRLQPAQMSGGTFTITNVGVFGVDAGTPILPPGQSGILAVGAIARRPWVDERDEVVPRWVTTVACSFDHRVADGEQGSRFLADVAAILHDPAVAVSW